eukprot:525039_1
MADTKYNDDSETDEDDKQTIVNGADYRAEIYEFPVHRDLSIVQCIGQIQCEYNYQIEHDYRVTTIGTGTVYKVADNAVFVVTCANNQRLRIYECKSCKKYINRKKFCKKCQQTLTSDDKKLLKPTKIEFKRRKTTRINFGLVECIYKCEEIYAPRGYDQNTVLTRGFDVAILMFYDNSKYYSEYCKNIGLEIGKKATEIHKRWCLFGYPGVDWGNAKKNKLYGYAMKSDAEKNGYELKKCDKPNGNFANPTPFML